MSREWKPGDVAAGPHGPMIAGEDGYWYARSGRMATPWRQQDGRLLFSGVRPLVVIDPEDREQVERLGKAIYDNGFTAVGRLADALHEFADPKPPKPEEPTGLGAVVEDADGADWHRTREGRWIAEDGLRSRAAGWVHIDAVRVLSEGVQL